MMSNVSPAACAADPPYVLLVDDHPPSLQRLHEVVERAGHKCVSAGSASDALSTCDACRPRVVVTDLAMPNLDGHGLACWLRARYPSVPVILVTGEALDPATRAAFRGTFMDMFTKPVDVESFLDRLDRLMPAPAAGSLP
jgi:CheY-like chemotaxis protein